MPWGILTQKLPIPREHFWAIIFFLDKNDINNFGPKGQPFKTIITWEEMLQSERSSMLYVVAQSRQTMRTRKRKRNKKIKEKLIVMSCTWKIRLSLNKNQEAKFKKNLKKMKNCNLFPLRELLFSLGNYVWDEKWPLS